MFAANVFTIIDSQDMQERIRLGPVALTSGDAQLKGRDPKIAHRFLELVGYRGQRPSHFWLGHSRRPGMMRGDE
jgi:hypothetical protein